MLICAMQKSTDAREKRGSRATSRNPVFHIERQLIDILLPDRGSWTNDSKGRRAVED